MDFRFESITVLTCNLNASFLVGAPDLYFIGHSRDSYQISDISKLLFQPSLSHRVLPTILPQCLQQCGY